MRSTLAYLLSLMLFLTWATSASSYRLYPPEITSHLTGHLTLTTTDGAVFKCHARLILKTRSQVKKGYVKNGGQVVEAQVSGQNCRDIAYVGLPWEVVITGPSAGYFLGGNTIGGEGGCSQSATSFVIESDGSWKLTPKGCSNGTLISNPQVTIVP